MPRPRVLNNDYEQVQFRLLKATKTNSKDWFGNVYTDHSKPVFFRVCGVETAISRSGPLPQYPIKSSTATKYFSVAAEFDDQATSKRLIANLEGLPSATTTYRIEPSGIEQSNELEIHIQLTQW
ncbi:hypothetical protein CPC08DRAFT_768790 [Agrocybe pediades]|nr:hypothetical protein CPC08DRAFT_768790 [Agrocybe pediades]